MRPKPAVGTPVALTVCVAAGLLEVGKGVEIRLKALKISNRNWMVYFSWMGKLRPMLNCLNCSEALRCQR